MCQITHSARSNDRDNFDPPRPAWPHVKPRHTLLHLAALVLLARYSFPLKEGDLVILGTGGQTPQCSQQAVMSVNVGPGDGE